MSWTPLCSLFLLACALTPSVSQNSCRGRCGIEYYRGYLCQCDYSCIAYGECCLDFETYCTTKETVNEAEQPFSGANDEDNYEIPLVKPISFPQDASDEEPESTSGYESTPAESLDPVSNQPTLITETPKTSTEAVSLAMTPTEDVESNTLDMADGSTATDDADRSDITAFPDSGKTSASDQISDKLTPTSALQPESLPATDTTLQNTAQTNVPTKAASNTTEGTPLFSTEAPSIPATLYPSQESSIAPVATEPSQDPSTSSAPPEPSQEPSTSSAPPQPSQEPSTSSAPPEPSQEPSTSSAPPEPSQEPSTSSAPPEPSQEPSTSSAPPEPSQEPSTSSVPPEPSQEPSTSSAPPEPSQEPSTSSVSPEPSKEPSTSSVSPEPSQEPSTPSVSPEPSTSSAPPEPSEEASTSSVPPEPSQASSTSSIPSEPPQESSISSVAPDPSRSSIPPDPSQASFTASVRTEPSQESSTQSISSEPSQQSISPEPSQESSTFIMPPESSQESSMPSVSPEPSQESPTPSVAPEPSKASSTSSVPKETSQDSSTISVPPEPSQESSKPSLSPEPSQASSTSSIPSEPSQASFTSSVPPDPSQEPSRSSVPPEGSQESTTLSVAPEPSQESSTPSVATKPSQESSAPSVEIEPSQESFIFSAAPESSQESSTPSVATKPSQESSAPSVEIEPSQESFIFSVAPDTTQELSTAAESSEAPNVPGSTTILPPSIATTLVVATSGPSVLTDTQNHYTGVSTVGSVLDVTTTVNPSSTDTAHSDSTDDVTHASPSVDPVTETQKPTGPRLTKPTSKPQDEPKLSLTTTKAPTNKPAPKPVASAVTVDNSRDFQRDDNNDTNLCSGRPASAVTTLRNGTIVVFRGHYFWSLDRNRSPGPARDITQAWGVPSPIDTVFTRCNCQGKTYIFKGNQYWRFENNNLDPGYPKAVETGFDGLRGHITAALSVPQYRSRRESVYFFKRGGMVQKYSYKFGTAPSCNRKPHYTIYTVRHRMVRHAESLLGPTINIRTAWRGFPTTVTSAVSVPSYREPEGYRYYVFSRTKSYNIRMYGDQPVVASPRENPTAQNNFINCPKTL
ncbi:proteoglycan 4b isoform X2 [Corythoichthys intestinalis]|uniref:proteoglycan 4b isoform X2 n=1 Tax=Corythoichthys intestinalis TaxID=161448 RepID=UPI0025A4D2A2|nr:proteoglycan 4b isoform X2 [Corythoichthys intestinalis]